MFTVKEIDGLKGACSGPRIGMVVRSSMSVIRRSTKIRRRSARYIEVAISQE